VVSLAELCNRSYLSKQRKGGKSNSTGNIFPASMTTTGKTKTGQQVPQKLTKLVNSNNTDQMYYYFCYVCFMISSCFVERKVRE
jgi:hypothetical protein